MPQTQSIPLNTYVPGSYGPFQLSNLDVVDESASVEFALGQDPATTLEYWFEVRPNNQSPWEVFAHGTIVNMVNVIDKWTGQLRTTSSISPTIPYRGSAGRDVRARFTVAGGNFVSAITVKTLAKT